MRSNLFFLSLISILISTSALADNSSQTQFKMGVVHLSSDDDVEAPNQAMILGAGTKVESGNRSEGEQVGFANIEAALSGDSSSSERLMNLPKLKLKLGYDLHSREVAFNEGSSSTEEKLMGNAFIGFNAEMKRNSLIGLSYAGSVEGHVGARAKVESTKDIGYMTETLIHVGARPVLGSQQAEVLHGQTTLTENQFLGVEIPIQALVQACGKFKHDKDERSNREGLSSLCGSLAIDFAPGVGKTSGVDNNAKGMYFVQVDAGARYRYESIDADTKEQKLIVDFGPNYAQETLQIPGHVSRNGHQVGVDASVSF